MRVPTALKAAFAAECWCLAHDFARALIREWKGWLAGSAPMIVLGVLGPIDPERVRLPAWSWAVLVFVAGLIAATFRVYRDLRQRHDALRDQITGFGVARPFLLVPFSGNRDSTHDL